MAGPDIILLDSARFTIAPWSWPFASERRAEIDAHYAARKEKTPELWNGRVLLLREPVFAGRELTGTFFETDFASFLAARDWGFPDPGVTNCFAMGAIRSSDGAYLLGVMGPHTSNAGHVYFPAGTPDLDDVAGDMVDLTANVMREVTEETGLTGEDFETTESWSAVTVIPRRIALMKVLQSREPAKALRTRILRHLALEQQPELADIRIVRSQRDITLEMPKFVTAFLEHALPRES